MVKRITQMAGNNIENIVSLLKDIIDKDGLSYPADEPYDVYKKLVESGTADRKIAAALLHFLVSGLWENAKCGGRRTLVRNNQKGMQS